jgi:hypothetical protein
MSMPPPAPNFTPPPWAMPPPMPGTGASSHFSYGAPVQMEVTRPGVYARPDKSIGISYVLWLFLGLLGVHHFYLGKGGRGVGYLFTCAWFTIGLWVDLFTLPAQVRRINADRRAGLR